jgi:hypothetical protein
MLYDETGTLQLPDGRQLKAANRYIYALRGDAIEIVFADGMNAGAHFLDLVFSPQHACGPPLESTGRHQCRLDNYDAAFRMENANRYELTYVVSGPRKGYAMRTVYTRQDHPGRVYYRNFPKTISQVEHVVL